MKSSVRITNNLQWTSMSTYQFSDTSEGQSFSVIAFIIYHLILSTLMKFKALPKKESFRDLSELDRRNKDKRDQINNQSKASRIIETDCKERLLLLQHQMKIFARLVELQVKKNQDLKTLLKSLQDKLDKGKLKQQEHANNENMEQLLKKRKKLENDMQQIILKNNESLAVMSLLKEQVNAARSERVIYSSIFKNLEREIRVNQEQFKKLIIQKYQVELEKDQAIKYYQKQEELRMNTKVDQPSVQPSVQPILPVDEEHSPQSNISSLMKLDLPFYPDYIKLEPEKKPLPKKGTFHTLAEDIQSHRNYLHRLQTDIGVDIEQVIELSGGIDAANSHLYERINQLTEQTEQLGLQIACMDKEIDDKRRTNQNIKEFKPTQEEQELIQLKAREEELEQAINKEERQSEQSISELLSLGVALNINIDDLQVGQLKEDNLRDYLAQIQRSYLKEFDSFEQPRHGQVPSPASRNIESGVCMSELLDKNEKSKEMDKIFTKAEFMTMGHQQIKKLKSKRMHRQSRKHL